MFSFLPKSFLNLLRFVVSLFSNFVVFIFFIIFFAVVVIGVYHTAIYLIVKVLHFYFYLFLPWSTLYFACLVLTLTNPVYSLLCLIFVFFQLVIVFLAVGAEFLAFVFLIVYVGAIAILFLFVIMLLNVKELSIKTEKTLSWFQVFIVSLLVFIFLNFFLFLTYELETFFLSEKKNDYLTEFNSTQWASVFVLHQFQDVFLFSSFLYNYYSYLFALLSFLLLTAMLGAIVLAASTFENC